MRYGETTVTNVSATTAVATSKAVYRGFSLRETSGAAAALVRVWDNASAAAGNVLDEIALSAGESAREWYESGIWAESGIYVQVVSGAVTGSIRSA